MKRYGTVIVFKQGVTRLQAEASLRRLEDTVLMAPKCYQPGRGQVAVVPMVHEFDDDLGGPVWYLP